MAPTSATTPTFATNIFSSSSTSLSRPTTRDGPDPSRHAAATTTTNTSTTGSSSISSSIAAAAKERKASFSRKASLPGSRRRGTWTATSTSSGGIVTDAAAPPALPDYALAAAAKIISRDKDKDRDKGSRDEGIWSPSSPHDMSSMLTRTASHTTMHMPPPTPVGAAPGINGSMWQQSESAIIHQQITDLTHKRISTLDYLRKSHEGRVYWFNTYLFDKPDLGRMPGYDPRKLARKATNYLLLGLSIPTINDLYSSTPLEFLRCLNALLSEFDSFQQLHSDSTSAASLTRARLPNMFRRPGTKSRRSTTTGTDTLMGDDSSQFAQPSIAGSNGGSGPAPAVMNFAASESDLLPGEEYTYLLTPSLPFDPDFFETFATLCDVLIDCYTRFLALVPTPRECSAPVAELFTKADSRMRKIIVQGVVKDFEDQSRTHVKSEVANIGKVVLGGLM